MARWICVWTQITGIPVSQWLVEADLDDITWVIREFGEDKHARRIAKGIIGYQENEENELLTRTGQLGVYLRRGSKEL